MKIFKFGIIGAGTMGKRMMLLMNNHPAFFCSGIYDPSSESMEQIRKLFPEIKTYTSADELIAATTTDCIYIASPPASHIRYMEACFNLNKAVFCEKPLSTSYQESEAMIKKAISGNHVVAVNFPFASAPSLQNIIQNINAIGGIEAIDIVIRFKSWPRPWQVNAEWLALRKEGGFTREVLSHFLFASQRITRSRLKLVEKCIQYPDNELLCETQLDALFVSSDIPVRISIGVGGDIDDDNRLIVNGKLGKFRMKEWYNGDQFLNNEWTPMELGSNPREATMRAQLDNLNLLLLRQPNLLATIEEAFHVQVGIESLLKKEM